MSVKTVDPLLNLSASSRRGPSPVIWDQFFGSGGPADYIQDLGLGMYFADDFLLSGGYAGGSATGSLGQWMIFSTANGAVADDGIIGGGLRLQASTTADQGVTLGTNTGAFQIITGGAAYQGMLAFETRVAVSTGSFTNSTQDSFIGLVDLPPATIMPITATNGSLSTTPNLIGFHKRGGTVNAADWNFVYQLASGTAVYPTNLQALITTVLGAAPSVLTYYKLGFLYDPDPYPVQITSASTGQTAGVVAKPTIKVFVNGLLAAAFLTPTNVGGAAFPTGIMGPSIAFLQQSTTAGIYTAVDWIRVAQRATS